MLDDFANMRVLILGYLSARLGEGGKLLGTADEFISHALGVKWRVLGYVVIDRGQVFDRRLGPVNDHSVKPKRARTCLTSWVLPASLSRIPASTA